MKSILGILLAAGLLASGLSAQAEPAGSLLNFRLPVFNEFGHRIWDLHAAAVRPLTADAKRFELSGVHLVILASDGSGDIEAELFAPVAVVDQPAKVVSGKGQLHVIGRGVELFGNDWICYAETKSIVIERDVVVTFSADLGNVLR